jgi:predicted lipid-binding transport protein (Tim44 family)
VSFWRLNWGRLIFLGVLVVAIVVGAIVGGDTGSTIAAIAGALLAMIVLGLAGSAVFLGRAPLGQRRPGPPPEDEGFYDDRD